MASGDCGRRQHARAPQAAATAATTAKVVIGSSNSNNSNNSRTATVFAHLVVVSFVLKDQVQLLLHVSASIFVLAIALVVVGRTGRCEKPDQAITCKNNTSSW